MREVTRTVAFLVTMLCALGAGTVGEYGIGYAILAYAFNNYLRPEERPRD